MLSPPSKIKTGTRKYGSHYKLLQLELPHQPLQFFGIATQLRRCIKHDLNRYKHQQVRFKTHLMCHRRVTGCDPTPTHGYETVLYLCRTVENQISERSEMG